MATLKSDPKFKEFSYGATIIEPEALDTHSVSDEDSLSDEPNAENGLTRTGRLFGGFWNDLKRKLPWYPSDYTDGFSLQVLATWLFLYFACLTPMITFGGLMGITTHNNMGTMETIVSGSICGIIFAIFSGQPLIILGSTGPVLVFEKILVNFCDANELSYLEFRLWVGIWIGIVLIILVATDASAFVSYITRFTAENFTTFIACIFIVEAVKYVMHIRTFPLAALSTSNHIDGSVSDYTMVLENLTKSYSWDYETDYNAMDDENPPEESYTDPSPIIFHVKPNYLAIAQGADEYEYAQHNSIFYFSLLLFIGTFLISYLLQEFRNSNFFPKLIRDLVSDFGVVIAIVGMCGIDLFAGNNTPKLVVPHEFAPTRIDRGWFIGPFGQNPAWSILGSIIPAIFASILIFMSQQTTAVIVNRRGHKLKKGAGYHLDLFILSILIIVSSFLGIPWFVAEPVKSLTNVNSLKIYSDTVAPGEKSTLLGVQEQRVSNILIFTTVGLSVFMTPIQSHVPMPVLYGVLLYMGFSALKKMELFERILLVFMPPKYQPEHLRQVPWWKVHLFTAIQITCLGMLWVIKPIKVTAIFFPLMLVVMIVVRKLLDYIFSQTELNALDDPFPSGVKNDKIQSLSSIRMSSKP